MINFLPTQRINRGLSLPSETPRGVSMLKDNVGEYYLGIYNGNIYAVSDNKSLVSIYMETHRGLTKDQYQIEQQASLESQILLKYEDLYLTKWKKYYLPSVDISIIEMDTDSTTILLDNTKSHLKELIRLLQLEREVLRIKDKDMERHIDEEAALIGAFKVLHRISTKKREKKNLSEVGIVVNSILYTPMEEYISIRNNYLDMVLRRDVWFDDEDDEKLITMHVFSDD